MKDEKLNADFWLPKTDAVVRSADTLDFCPIELRYLLLSRLLPF